MHGLAAQPLKVVGIVGIDGLHVPMIPVAVDACVQLCVYVPTLQRIDNQLSLIGKNVALLFVSTAILQVLNVVEVGRNVAIGVIPKHHIACVPPRVNKTIVRLCASPPSVLILGTKTHRWEK